MNNGPCGVAKDGVEPSPWKNKFQTNQNLTVRSCSSRNAPGLRPCHPRPWNQPTLTGRLGD